MPCGAARSRAYSATDDGCENGQGQGPDPATLSPTSPEGPAKALPFLDGPPADLRGVFTRRYRWGTIDVLAPEHCDFAALRTAVLSTHMKARCLVLVLSVMVC